MYTTEPVHSRQPGPLVVGVRRLWITDDLLTDGLSEDTALAVELTIGNQGAEAVTVGAASFSCLLSVDPKRPEATLSLPPVAGAEGDFPDDLPPEGSLLAPVSIAAHERKPFWILFRGYRYPDSDVPRRVTIRVDGAQLRPGEPATAIVLDVADPARGGLQWSVAPPSGGWTIGIENVNFVNDHLRGLMTGSRLSRLTRVGPVLWEVALVSCLLVETKGSLASATSSFGVSGLASAVTAPVYSWGRWQDPRQAGIYWGGEALLAGEVQRSLSGDMTMKPRLYGALAIDVGVEVDVGAIRLAASPFPLVAGRRGLPRWSWRAGYTHWWINGAGTDGVGGAVQLAW